MKTVLPLLSEYLGTFFLVLSVLSLSNPIFIGIIFTVIIFLTVAVSGASLNPAISIVMYMGGKLGYEEMFAYIFIQVVAAISAFYVFKVIK
jgi:glycerol uptake facilitator-like aquaporin